MKASAPPAKMTLSALLFSQGFGTRRECAALVLAGEVALAGESIDDPQHPVLVHEGLVFHVSGQAWPFHRQALILLHKPTGYECSQKPRDHPSVLSLLPAVLRTRGLQPVGRLDADTTGLLLLTDDGGLIHRLTSPKHHVAKVYEAELKHDLDEAQLRALRDGVLLHDEPTTLRAEAALALGPRRLQLTLTQGKYHQVKRMVAASGNRVEALHRSAFGPWQLPPNLAPGQWEWASLAGGATTPSARPVGA